MQPVQAEVLSSGQLFEPETFDVVLCHMLIEFVADPPRLIEPLVRVLRPDGTLSLTFSNRFHTP